jgi:hypothetical protein
LNLAFSAGIEAGLSLTHSIGYRFNQFLGVGAGVGIENFELGWGKRVIPVFLEGRGYLSKKKISPYYAIRAGWGFALKYDDFNITEAKGGYMLNPEIGYRFGANPHLNFTLGMGVRFQRVSYTTEWEWNRNIQIDKITYQRIEIKAGILF